MLFKANPQFFEKQLSYYTVSTGWREDFRYFLLAR